MTILQSAIAQSATSTAAYQISRSLRFNSADSAYLTRTPATTSNQKTYTWSGWVKRGTLGGGGCMFGAGNSGTNFCNLIYESSTDKISWFTYEGSTSTNLVTTQVFRDTSAWYHVVLAVDTTQATSTNRAKIYVNGVQITAFGTATYPAQNTNNVVNTAQIPCGVGAQMSPSPAVFFNGYMTEVNFIDGQQLDPTSFGATDANTGIWNPIAYTGSYGTNGFYLPYSDNAGADSFGIGTDLSASALNRVELGNTSVGYTVLGTMTYGVGAAAVNLRDNNPNTAAADPNGINVNTAMGYDFGRAIKIRKITTLTALTSGVSYNLVFNIQYSDNNSTWTTITGTPTTHNISAGTGQSNSTSFDDNGSHRYWRLFYSSGTIGGDCWIATLDMFINSIGPNSWFPVNFSVTAGVGNDSLVDSPTNYGTDTGAGGEVRGNYATLNPLQNGSEATLANGNLDVTFSGASGSSGGSTIAVSSGKWYCEVTRGSSGLLIGLIPSSYAGKLSNWPGNSAYGSESYGYLSDNGNKYNNSTGTAYGASYATGDVIGIALDLTAGTLTFYKNGTSQGTAFSSLASSYIFAVGYASGSTGGTAASFNAGQRPFAYTAPSGFKALCTQNLPTPAIGATSTTLANDYFDVSLWTGNAVSGRAIVTDSGFAPDWVWAKCRSGAPYHTLNDIVRGTNNILQSNTTSAEIVGSNGYVTAFNANGFSISDGSDINGSGATFVGWLWKGGGTGVSNTSGSITSTVSASTTAGFSVVTYTGNGTSGATFGHGLGAVPKMIIFKCRNFTYQWLTYHVKLGNTAFLVLDADSAQTTGRGDFLNSTTPSSSLVTLGNTLGINESTRPYVAYCFAEVAGFSKINSYIGNGSSDGTFIYTGFRPRYIMIKGTNANHWSVKDTARSPSNVALANLFPNLASAETSEYDYDILSNGFKLRTTSTTVNSSGQEYIFMAFAESPFNYSRAR